MLAAVLLQDMDGQMFQGSKLRVNFAQAFASPSRPTRAARARARGPPRRWLEGRTRLRSGSRLRPHQTKPLRNVSRLLRLCEGPVCPVQDELEKALRSSRLQAKTLNPKPPKP